MPAHDAPCENSVIGPDVRLNRSAPIRADLCEAPTAMPVRRVDPLYSKIPFGSIASSLIRAFADYSNEFTWLAQ